MSTWHQQQPLKRALAEAKKTGRFIHPWAHQTEFQVIESAPNQSAFGCGRYKTYKEAISEALKNTNRFVIPPIGVTV